MNIDYLKLGHFEQSNDSIDIALPVLAYECELKEPLENELDAYEEAALKYVSIGLAERGIASGLNINEGLSGQILSKLISLNYITKIKGIGYKMSESGEKYLQGVREEKFNSNSKYGYMFVSAIKKDVFPYFFEGDIGNIERTNGKMDELRVLVDRNEEKTFYHGNAPKLWRLEQAYKDYLRMCKDVEKVAKHEEPIEKVQDKYADYDSFEEIDYEEMEETIVEEKTHGSALMTDAFIRPLKKNPIFIYLKMQIVVSPNVVGGYSIRSPLDLKEVDKEFFLRQIQWLQGNDDVYFQGRQFGRVVETEITKLCGSLQMKDKDASVFILERIPALAKNEQEYSIIFNKFTEVYAMMNQQLTQLNREIIVRELNKIFGEQLLNKILRAIDENERKLITNSAMNDIREMGEEQIKIISKHANISRELLPQKSTIISTIKRLPHTCGNSLLEKFINIIIVNYYSSSPVTKNLIHIEKIDEFVTTICNLNKIRNKAVHDHEEGEMTRNEYEYYIANIVNVANKVIDAIEGEY